MENVVFLSNKISQCSRGHVHFSQENDSCMTDVEKKGAEDSNKKQADSYMLVCLLNIYALYHVN